MSDRIEELIEQKMQEESALGAYKRKRKEIDSMFKQITAALKKHEAEQKQEPLNWGYHGDLGKVYADLADIYQFIHGL